MDDPRLIGMSQDEQRGAHIVLGAMKGTAQDIKANASQLKDCGVCVPLHQQLAASADMTCALVTAIERKMLET